MWRCIKFKFSKKKKQLKDPEVRESDTEEPCCENTAAFPKRDEVVAANKPNTVQCSACNASLLPWMVRCTGCYALITGGSLGVELGGDPTPQPEPSPTPGEDNTTPEEGRGGEEEGGEGGGGEGAEGDDDGGFSLLRRPVPGVGADGRPLQASAQVRQFRKQLRRAPTGGKPAAGAMTL